MKAILLFIACLAMGGAARATEVQQGRELSTEEWREDFAFLKDRLIALHPDPFREADQATFDSQFAALGSRLPQMTKPQMLVELMRLVATVGDGHTSLLPGMQSGFLRLPLRFHVLDGKLYLTGADAAYRQGLGGQLVSINSVPAAELLKRARSITSGDNASSVDARLPANIVISEVLAGLGIAQDAESPVRLELQLDGKRVVLNVPATPASPGHPTPSALVRYSADWADLAASSPAWLSRAQDAYWFEYQPASRSIYVQYNRAASDPADPMPAFARRLREEINARKPDRVVLDLRHNLGGEAFWNRPLLLALLRSDSLETRGKLFALIGRDTFSAGTLMAIELEKYSSAIFVGEPTGGGLQNFGNHEPVRLPNSGLTVMVATKYYQNNGPNDDREWLAPQIYAPISPAALLAGRDPGMEAALAYRSPNEVLKQQLLAAAPARTEDVARALLGRPIYRYLATEPLLTGVGYEFIQAKDHARAIALMQLAVGLNPHNANAHDSLGDAFRAAGGREAAIASYRKALAINPGWESARRSLQELGASAPAAASH